jgi:hypothetical protein
VQVVPVTAAGFTVSSPGVRARRAGKAVVVAAQIAARMIAERILNFFLQLRQND